MKIFLAENREDSEGVIVACKRNQLTEKMTRNLPDQCQQATEQVWKNHYRKTCEKMGAR